MQNASSQRTSGTAKESDLNASKHALGNTTTEGAKSMRQPSDKDELLEIAADIRLVKERLEKEGVKSTWLGVLGELAARVKHASSTRHAPTGGVEGRLKAIEETLKKIANPKGATGPTWATIAQGGTRLPGETPGNPPTKHSVRASMPQAKGLTNQEILDQVRKAIPEAAAVRTLYSGDIDITVPTETAKERA